MGIEKVIICGLGALGLTYANKLKRVCDLKILADYTRIEKYRTNQPKLNGKEIKLEYLLPEEKWEADLIIISTKNADLTSALEYIKNFVTDKTVIISLINGISSENIIAKVYPQAHVVRSFFIGHSAMRNGTEVIQDGIGKIVCEQCTILLDFFSKSSIDYEVVDDITYSMWLKLAVNIVLNELTAIYKCSVGELRGKEKFLFYSQGLIAEIQKVAKACGVNNLERYEEDVFKAINLVADDGLTSMYQDIIAERKTEVDIFSGEIIRLGKIYNIATPLNLQIYNKIKDIERAFL